MQFCFCRACVLRSISGNMDQKRTFVTPCLQSKVTLTRTTQTLTPISLQSRCESHLQTCSYKKPGSIEVVSETFQSKSVENWDNEFAQCPHLRDPRLAHYMVVTYTFYILRLFRAQGCDEDDRTSLTIGLKVVCCIIIVLVSS